MYGVKLKFENITISAYKHVRVLYIFAGVMWVIDGSYTLIFSCKIKHLQILKTAFANTVIQFLR
jgi:hypothetical protein